MPIVFGVDKKPPKSAKLGGYAGLPGKGPKGETCRSCANLARFRKWSKCWLMKSFWTGGRGTDVLLRSPACGRWSTIELKKQEDES